MMNTPHIRDYVGKHVHMIGIGGSSMSGLAQMLISKGYQVSGSDRTEGYLIGDVRAAGANVFIGHAAERRKEGEVRRQGRRGEVCALWRRREACVQ